ncbi:MAG: family transporter solute-binding subunit [Sporomusa sp.]|jgi:TRAP transporter TAXI family solute receptor|nr:family transporter solute-binding subunit [Sporomusa sp.]
MKKSMRLLVVALTVMFLLSGCGGTQPQDLNVATASIGGAFYPVGQEISNLVSKHAKGLTMVPEVTGGAVENPRLLDKGECDFGITNANIGFYAYEGTDPFTEPLKIQAVGNLHASVFHIITMADSPINSIADLKGKKIAVGPSGGGTLPILELILQKYGMTMDDIVASYLSYADGFEQLSDGNVDVALAMSGYPASSVVETSTSNKIKFLEPDQKVFDEITAEYSYYDVVTVPANEYKLDKDAKAIGVNNVLIVRKDLDEDTVYKVTKAIYDNLKEFGENNASAKQISPDTAGDTAIELHPGAAKYFKEKSKK